MPAPTSSTRRASPATSTTPTATSRALVPFEIDPDVAGIDNIEVTSVPSKPVVGAYYYFYVNLGSTTGNQFTAVNGSAVVKYDAGDKGMVQVKGEWSFDMPSDAGTYAVVVGRWNGSNNWDFVDVADTFTIASYSLADATLIDDDDVTDTDLRLDGRERQGRHRRLVGPPQRRGRRSHPDQEHRRRPHWRLHPPAPQQGRAGRRLR